MQGACMFHAIRKGMECPREFTNTHLRRMVLLFIIENFDMLWPLLHVRILSNFGHIRMPEEEFQQRLADGTLSDHDRAVHDEPGPFSVHGYLSQLLKPGFYGEELCLLIISMMWKVRITILHAETLRSIKVRHMNVALKADFVLVHCSGSHYICLGIGFSILQFLNLLHSRSHLHTLQFTFFLILMIAMCLDHKMASRSMYIASRQVFMVSRSITI